MNSEPEVISLMTLRRPDLRDRGRVYIKKSSDSREFKDLSLPIHFVKRLESPTVEIAQICPPVSTSVAITTPTGVQKKTMSSYQDKSSNLRYELE